MTDPGPMCGGGGKVQVMNVETRGQPDAGWLAATIGHFIGPVQCDLEFEYLTQLQLVRKLNFAKSINLG